MCDSFTDRLLGTQLQEQIAAAAQGPAAELAQARESLQTVTTEKAALQEKLLQSQDEKLKLADDKMKLQEKVTALQDELLQVRKKAGADGDVLQSQLDAATKAAASLAPLQEQLNTYVAR